jgi:hypothetical protein
MQYCNMTGATSSATTANNTGNSNCSSALAATGSGPVDEIDAAVFALTGSLLTDNYNRGVADGNVTVVGGIYQLHRGATGQQWETQSTDANRASSGYVLQDTYLNLLNAQLPYVPALQSGSAGRGWNVISVSSDSS